MKCRKDPEIISQYLFDESNAFIADDAGVSRVCYPESEGDIVEIIRGTYEKITVSGAGTGITGSRVPMNGGIVISTERMLKSRPHDNCLRLCRKGLAGDIEIYLDEEKQLLHAAPGISLSELAATLPPGWTYPPDPTETSATLGGTVATNASGARCFYFGPTRAWVKGLRIVLANGEVLDIKRGESIAGPEHIEFRTAGGKTTKVKLPGYKMPDIKNAAGIFSKPGMDLIDLFIGSEGILGIVTEITIALWRQEGETISDLAFFHDQDQAMDYVDRLRKMKDRGILAIEFFDSNALDFVREEHPELKKGLGAAVLVELLPDSMDLMAEISEMLAQHNAAEDWCAHTLANRRDLREFRHSLPDGINAYLRQHDSYKLGTDFVVPEDSFRNMMSKYEEIGQIFKSEFPRAGSHYVIFGHIGDCHVHMNFITANDSERISAKKHYLELARHAISLGGTISGEHGVGKKSLPENGKNIPYLELMYGKPGLIEISRLKSELDPGLRLNLGNMVPIEFFEG